MAADAGALMVAVLKLIAICYNRQDGVRQKAHEKMSQEDTALLIQAVPNPLHFASYILATGNVLAGPFNEYNDYMAFTERSGPWAQAFAPGMWKPALVSGLSCTGSAIFMLLGWSLLNTKFSHFALVGESVWQMPYVQRVAYAMLMAMIGRLKFYTVWTFSEAGLNASGFGFNGFTDGKLRSPKFDRYINSYIWQVRLHSRQSQNFVCVYIMLASSPRQAFASHIKASETVQFFSKVFSANVGE